MSTKRMSNEELFERLIAIVCDEMHHGDLSLDAIASRLALSPSQLNRRVKDSIGIPVSTFVMRLRIEQAELLLAQSPRYSVSEVAALCGFADSSHFAHAFRRVRGLSPSAYIDSLAKDNDHLRQFIDEQVRKRLRSGK